MIAEPKIQPQRDSTQDSAMLSAVQDTVMEWQSEMYSLQKESTLLKRIVGMIYFSKRCMDANGNDV